MPYKADGNRVLVRKKGKWMLLKSHPTVAKAKAHAAALNANVTKKGK